MVVGPEHLQLNALTQSRSPRRGKNMGRAWTAARAPRHERRQARCKAGDPWQGEACVADAPSAAASLPFSLRGGPGLAAGTAWLRAPKAAPGSVGAPPLAWERERARPWVEGELDAVGVGRVGGA